MADYDSAPVIQEEGEILLYGHRYRLASDTKVQVSLATKLPEKQVFGDYGDSSNPTFSTWTIDDLRGGSGLLQYSDTKKQLNRFYESTFMNTLWANAITVADEYDSTTFSSPAAVPANTDLNVLTKLSGRLIGIWGTATAPYYYNSGSWTVTAVALGGTVQAKPTEFLGSLYYPLGSYGYATQTAYNANATNVAAGAADPAAQDFVVWDNKLYAIDTANVLWVSATGAGGSWTSKVNVLPVDLDVDYPYSRLVIYRDRTLEPVIWVLTHEGPFTWDETSDRWYRQDFSHPYFRYPAVRRSTGIVWHGSLYVQTGPLDVYKLTMTADGLQVEDVSMSKDDGLFSQNSVITDWEQNNEGIYCLVSRNEEFSDVDAEQHLMMYHEGGWHPTLWLGTGEATATLRTMVILHNSSGRRLYFALGTTSATKVVGWLDLATQRQNPVTSDTKRFTISDGQLWTPFFSADYPGQTKLAVQARVKLRGASATDYVTPKYQLNGDVVTASTALSAVTANTEQTLRMGTNNVGVEFKSIRWHLLFTTDATVTTAPKLEYIALDYLRIPPTWKGFIVQIDVRENDPEARSGSQVIADLWTAIGTATLGTFGFRDDSGNINSYLVKVLAPQGEENTGLNEQGRYVLALASYGGNS